MSFLSMALEISQESRGLPAQEEKGYEITKKGLTDDDPVPALMDLAAVLGMRLSAFARSGSWLRIRSALLGEDIVLAADNAVDLPGGFPVYRAAEIPHLIGLDGETIKRLHRVKILFSGELASRGEDASALPSTPRTLGRVWPSRA